MKHALARGFDVTTVMPSLTDEEAWTVLNFADFVKKECNSANVKFDLRKSKSIRDGKFTCAGWFTSDKPAELVVAMNRADALEILVHEYAHMTQWMDGILIWYSAGDSILYVSRWLENRSVADIDYHIGMVRDMELDNEMRSVDIIKAWNLPIDIDKYIQKANAYLMFYNWLRVSRRWSRPAKSPYTSKAIVESMSTKFDMNYEKFPPELQELFQLESI
jgi:hypothetical protein